MEDQNIPDAGFVQNVKKYLDICNDLDAAKDEIKIVTDSKKELEMMILEFMDDNNLDELEAGDGFKIRLRTSKSTKPLNKDSIYTTLLQALKKEEAELLTAKIFDNRETSEKMAISRIKPRKRQREDE